MNESYHSDYHQFSAIKLAESRIEPKTSCSHVPYATDCAIGLGSFGLQKHELSLYNTTPTIIDLERERFENIVGTGENAGNQQHFLLFPQCFRVYQGQM